MKDIQVNILQSIQKASLVVNNRKRNKVYYKDLICSFDIETTRLDDDQSIMYIWQMDLEGQTITGRTWEDFEEIINAINYFLGDDARLIIWVHNLSYEFSFLKGILNFDDVFMVRPRKVLYALCGSVEFRCSYFLSNMNLEKFLEQMQVENKKLSYDYEKKRYPWTELSPDEMAYCINDVKGLSQAIRKRLENEGDTLATIPLTSTGYIRRDARKVYNKISYYYRKSLMPTLGLYRLLRDAFRGGNCHANRWISGAIMDDVISFDRASSYPDVMVTCPFPASSFYHIGRVSVQMLEHYIEAKKACIVRAKLYNLDLLDRTYPIPYIARHKCRYLKNPIIDNGRVISADICELVFTDIDYKILKYQYGFTMEIIDFYYARYGEMRQCIKDLVIRDYAAKTELKGTGKDYEYARSKERVNAYYGMTAQDPLRDNIIYVGGDEVFTYEGKEPVEILEKSANRAFLPYQIGVWVTSWARYRLEQGIRAVHENGGLVCYVDTDSVKFTGMNDDIQKAFNDFNNRAAYASDLAGMTATDSKGIKRPSGVFELDGQYSRFKTLGAKKYVYEDEKGLHITIAGVGKKEGAAELGSIENFKEGFTFVKAGGLEAVYNDNVDITRTIEGHPVRIRDNVCLRPSTYTIGMTQDYKDLLYKLSQEYFFDRII